MIDVLSYDGVVSSRCQPLQKNVDTMKSISILEKTKNYQNAFFIILSHSLDVRKFGRATRTQIAHRPNSKTRDSSMNQKCCREVH